MAVEERRRVEVLARAEEDQAVEWWEHELVEVAGGAGGGGEWMVMGGRKGIGVGGDGQRGNRRIGGEIRKRIEEDVDRGIGGDGG